MTDYELLQKINALVNGLSNISSNPIDFSLSPVLPFRGKGPVKLVFIGQDPTIRNVSQREKVSVTLNLNKKGALRSYLGQIVEGLGFSFDQVYATNLFKYFYTIPPADTREVLLAHLQPNADLLKEELQEWGDCAIITLGEPVLQLLTSERFKVHDCWNYRNCGFHSVEAKDTLLERRIYPFPHQPSMNKSLYREQFGQYLEFMKEELRDIVK